MPKDEWGTKRVCPHCGARFYDLKADPMTCPVCATGFTVESLVAGRGRSLVSEKAASRDIADDDVIDKDDEDLDDNADSDSEIDDDLLEDDDDGDVSLDDIADVPGDDDEA